MQGDINYDPGADWVGDAKGKKNMEFPDFFDAVFELADVWCGRMEVQGQADPQACCCSACAFLALPTCPPVPPLPTVPIPRCPKVCAPEYAKLLTDLLVDAMAQEAQIGLFSK